MHLFLIRNVEPQAFAHLHPVQRRGAEFEVALPPLPAGQYDIYADITHEDGFSETLTAMANLLRDTGADGGNEFVASARHGRFLAFRERQQCGHRAEACLLGHWLASCA